MTGIVDHDGWTMTEQGRRLPQTSSPAVIRAMLDLLDVRPGLRVLEIGTGSGYSSALLSHAVGPSGHVVTLDIDDALIARAHDLHRRAGTTNVDPRVGDGYQGWAAGGPYDRIIAWATPHVLPRPWMEQVTPGAVVVTSVKVAEVALANAVLRCHVTGGQPWLLSPHPGSMIEMHARVLTEFRLPIRYVDAARHTPQGPCWISGAALHAHPSAAAELLRDLTPTMTPLPSAPENRDGFKAWVLATHPDQAATAGDPEGWGIGLAGHDSAAVVRPDGTIHHAGSDRLLHQLRRSVRAWNDAGQPGFEALTAHAHPTAEGWAVRVSRRQQGLTDP
ncbi:protein-L-isoaspartate O-methyltransferase family protein [Actinoalloteichus caeruleus]|uniref:protein-L-isoaspartate O-methyltransferase family protein n=1 Tax=Actinoalloteichus cyanogriseus TaxID=2893586 RepID=UPI003AAA9BDF